MKLLRSLRAVLVTGKGGVGKTTFAVALAKSIARTKRRVLLAEISSDPSATSPLALALGENFLNDEPRELADFLHAVLLTPVAGHHRFLRDTLPVRVLADAAMKSTALKRFLLAAPTFSEMGVLYRILDLSRQTSARGEPRYETIVIDLPATGHALALAQIPEALLRVIHSGPIGSAVREGLELLTDPDKTGAVVMTLPEMLPVSEALELIDGLRRSHVPVAAVALNRLPRDPFSDRERDSIDRLLAREPHLLGSRAIKRLDRARLAETRIRSGVDVPLIAIDEVNVESAEVANALASIFEEQVEQRRIASDRRGESEPA